MQLSNKAKYTPIKAIATAEYKAIGTGIYEYVFNVQSPIFELKKNTVYILERMSVAGDIDEQLFLSSVTDPIEIDFRYSNSKNMVYNHPIPILKYSDDKNIRSYIQTATDTDLIFKARGRCKQIEEFIGKESIKLFFSFELFAIDSSEYNKNYMQALDTNAGNFLRG